MTPRDLRSGGTRAFRPVVRVLLVAVVLFWIWGRDRWSGLDFSTEGVEAPIGTVVEPRGSEPATGGPPRAGTAANEDVERVRQAYREGVSDIEVQVSGAVVRTLPDDTDGSPHQRFIVDIGGHTVLVSHNIELAPRAPLSVGDRVTVRGEYEWNGQGGVIHWTHHDPQGRRDGGWIRHEGRTYR